ncbi:25286_t:CDS:2 [Gigaspora rosea]|nr:25286_t:CDS:2 [Gigaspora rosea]
MESQQVTKSTPTETPKVMKPKQQNYTNKTIIQMIPNSMTLEMTIPTTQ